jgi:DNA invertase Pin-like site-specific DNA recombinase
MSGRIGPSHLERRAFVYVRQSTAAQVFQHGESTQRQYALAKRAEALGWGPEAIEVIDEDQGKSGATTEGRGGFARLVGAVAHGEAGAIFAIEVSRLARSSEDWQRLLSLCAVAEVVVVDEQTTYDPGNKDDKLLLDIKGTMSEAELHWLGLRLTGARQSKARRGALRIPAPTGYVWGERGLDLDPDEAVQGAVRLVFERYAVEPSVWAVVRWARETGLAFPTRRRYADGTTTVTWKPLGMSRLHEIMKSPIYAGVYTYGRRPTRKALVDGEIHRVRASGRDPDAWAVRIEDAHPGYITWETFVKNQQKLQDNLNRMGRTTPGAPREGAALLTGLLLCGRCGRRMATTYRTGRARWSYVCVGARDRGQVLCWTTPGAPLDHAVEQLFLETMVPSELELSLAVEREVGAQAGALDRQHKARLEQAAYEARHAERRYKAVDPDNRVVARTLEREWEQRLVELEQLERQHEQAKRERRVELSAEDRARIRALGHDLPKVWRARTTQQADRKAMLRLVIEAISLSPVDVPARQTRVCVAWKSGAVAELMVARPDRRSRARTAPAVVERLRTLAAAGLRDEEIAEQLNRENLRTGWDKTWNVPAVKWARRREAIGRAAPDAPRRLPLPERHPDGRYSVAGVAKRFGVGLSVVRGWIARGVLSGHRESYEQHTGVWWLRLDDETSSRLEKLAAARLRR